MLPRTVTDGVVRLDPITLETAKTFPKWVNDEEVAKFLGHYRDIPSTAQEEEWYKKTAESETDHVWEIVYDNQIVGMTGIHHINQNDGHAITGIVIGEKNYWHKGIATRTMILRARYAFNEFQWLHKLKTQVFTENTYSMRATEKCGYESEGIFKDEIHRNGRWHNIDNKALFRDRFYELHQK